jgi:DNA polymerase-2
MIAEDPLALSLYCLKDAVLVQGILEKTGLLDLTLRRCGLIGVATDRAWTSIPAFEHLYIEAMHSRGRIAPTQGVDALPMEGAPGGAILTPEPGLHTGVSVLDFRSLYPSIIRTFNIDPMSYDQRCSDPHAIHAPNKACFRRERGILPELLDVFFDRREVAREAGDNIASYVYKIIMNSFYGVLGTSNCRFAGSALAGAVTSFGKHILVWCRDLLRDHGYRVIYGDTDSLFVAGGSGGQVACDLVNEHLAYYCRRKYGVEAQLYLEFEKQYTHFFLPPLRGDGSRGRAKGYAGRIANGGSARIEVRGMEAARSDWTDLARELQVDLLELLFDGADAKRFRDHLADLIGRLEEGGLDDKLVYRKHLRKAVDAYVRNVPPHVRAAKLLPQEDRQGMISYLITRNGPQPLGAVSSPIDYRHYVERQVAPIVSAFAPTLGVETEALLEEHHQLWLF